MWKQLAQLGDSPPNPRLGEVCGEGFLPQNFGRLRPPNPLQNDCSVFC
ncbi:hypothetical protein FDUTEX481_00781 [Tolypothrix sp. PCC 7601]|nr:hypothetical protein FDUTEX481_00781 [Tolypothrix sp. PCC 7601]